MAAREYQLEIDAIDATLVSIEKVLDLPKLRKQAEELEVEAGVPNLWDDPEAAQKITSRLSRVQSEIAKLSEEALKQYELDLAAFEAAAEAELEELDLKVPEIIALHGTVVLLSDWKKGSTEEGATLISVWFFIFFLLSF